MMIAPPAMDVILSAFTMTSSQSVLRAARITDAITSGFDEDVSRSRKTKCMGEIPVVVDDGITVTPFSDPVTSDIF